MCAARSVLGGNVRAFDVEAVHRLAVRQTLARCRQVAQRSYHGIGRTGNHRGVKPRDTGGEQNAERSRDLFLGSRGVVVVHRGEAIHLQIDPSGRQIDITRLAGRSDRIDHIVKRDVESGRTVNIPAGTIHRCA